MGDANSLVIWFEATGEESLGMLFKFFDQHPSMRDTCDDVLLEVSWQNKMGRREETYFSFQYVVGSHVFSHGSFPWFTSTDENGEEVTHTCVLTWADLNALHKGVPRLNDLLTWKKKKMNGTMR
ncbi:MAG TPA: hypothetical protein PK765_06640 [bacterium]|nr:hypothetical protein [bacterium]